MTFIAGIFIQKVYMTQFPLDKDLVPPALNVHLVLKNDVYGARKILGVFRQFSQAREFIEDTFPRAPKRRVLGFEVYDLADGEFVEVDTWAVT